MNNFKPEILEEELSENLKWKHLKRKDHIGSGSYASVYKYTHRKNAQTFAVKIMRYDETKEEYLQIRKEIELQNFLMKIPNCFDYFPFFYGFVRYRERTEVSQTDYFALIFELADGTLKNLVEDQRTDGLTFQENMLLLECFANGLSKLQEDKICHRDLKPGNILFTNNKGYLRFKVMDFGEVKINVDKEGTIRGTPIYFSPELNYAFLHDLEKLDENYNPYKSDVYSIGLIMLYVNMRDLPFPKNQNANMGSCLSKNASRKSEKNYDPAIKKNGPFDDKIKEMILKIAKKFENEKEVELFKKIIEKCLEYNPNNRFDLIMLKDSYKELLSKRGMTTAYLTNNAEELKNIIQIKDEFIKKLEEKNESLSKELEKEKKESEALRIKFNELLKSGKSQSSKYDKGEEIGQKKKEKDPGKIALNLEELFRYKNTAGGYNEILIEFNNTHVKNINERFFKTIVELNVFTCFPNLKKLRLNLINSNTFTSEGIIEKILPEFSKSEDYRQLKKFTMNISGRVKLLREINKTFENPIAISSCIDDDWYRFKDRENLKNIREFYPNLFLDFTL